MKLKQQIRELYDKQGYVSDQQAVDITKQEDGWIKKDRILKDYKRFLADKKFFADKKIIGKQKGHRMYVIIIKAETTEICVKCCKEFYQTLLAEKLNT